MINIPEDLISQNDISDPDNLFNEEELINEKEEANINKADIAIAVTSKDKDNLLASLLSQMSGAASTLSLVNSRSFDNLVDNINSNVIIDRSSITISNI